MPTIYLHWTATNYNWVVPGHYHTIVTGDGKIHRLHAYDRDLPSHTYARNTDSVGVSLACMGGDDPWSTPPTGDQIDAICKEVAAIIKDWGWKEEDISIKNILTHAEAAANLDGGTAHENYGPVVWGGTGERWDLMQLVRNGADDGGEVLRSIIRGYFRGEALQPDTAKLKFGRDSQITADEKTLPVSIDDRGITWAAIADLLKIYALEFSWNAERRQIVLADAIAPRYLTDKVQSNIGHPLCELVSSDGKVILTGIIRGDRAWCQVLEFAEELGISCTFKPLVLGKKRGG